MRYALALLIPLSVFPQAGSAQEASGKTLHRVVDLNLGESHEVELSNGKKVTVKLLDLEETREEICSALWLARVKVAVAGAETWLTAGTYNLPVTLGGVQIDCTVTKGVYQNAANDYWGLVKDARLRLWPAGSPLVEPGTFVYPLKQRWFAGDTWMANEPMTAMGSGIRKGDIYYHSGLDIGGSEGLIEVVSATDGLVVRVYKEVLPEHKDRAVNPGYPQTRLTNEVFILDDRGRYHWYVHMKTVDVRPGQKVNRGEKLGLLGKEGGSGGWSHLHYEIFAQQPSGRPGSENAYPFIWEAYMQEYAPAVVAVAGPIHHQLAPVGRKVELESRLSRAFVGQIARTEWLLSDGSTASGPTVARTYERPGTYSEVLKVTDTAGRVDYDFALVYVVDKKDPGEPPPRPNANYAPTFGIRPGDPVTFKVRTFNTKEGEETWDFGDGSAPVNVRSRDSYAETVHRYEKPGHYLVRVERTGHTGAKGVTHLQVRVREETASAPALAGSSLKVAAFSCDATPPIGHPLIGKKNLEVVDDPLLLKGIVLQGPDSRIVIAALDWCTMGTPIYEAFRRKLAAAAETTESRVSIHCIHTHSAPFQNDVEAAFLTDVTNRASVTVRDALARLRPFSHVGLGKAKVVEFASNRRVPGPDGKIRVRWSATKDASLRAEAEGKIDPWLRTITFFEGEKPMVRLHYYASHPQSFYGDGHAHPDAPGWARARLEKEEGIPQIYFTGCAGNITAGKYNDGSPEARARLIERLYAGMKGGIADTRPEKAVAMAWKTTRVNFVPRPKENLPAWPPVELSLLRMGSVDLVHLPGEPFVEFQLHAQSLRPDRFVCVAGYGDGGPGYICTDDAEGGYEPTASHVGPPSEKLLRSALEELLK